MADKYLVEPDLNFVQDVIGLGGDTLKKCFQCATCSVACPIAPDDSPFPRKEMIATSWGLKDKVVASGDIWLCHNCGDCTTMCPRGAKPGEVLEAVRYTAIKEYATPKILADVVNDPKKLPWLIGIPAVIFAILAIITNIFSDSEFLTHGVPADIIAPSHFVSSWFVDLVFVPLSGLVVLVFALGLYNFVQDIHKNALLEGKTDKKDIDFKEFMIALWDILPTILKHDKFNECGENKSRSTAHMMVLYSFLGLFVVTGIFFVVLYLFHIPGPYSQLNPVKWIANISGIALIIGSGLLIKNRLTDKETNTLYKDWYILGLVFGLGLTGMLTEMARLAGAAGFSYLLYYLHLILIFNLFAFLPFSKMAHLVYRTVAMAYAQYSNRK